MGGFRLRQREFVHDGAGARERIHCLIDSLRDPRITVAPQNGSPTPMRTPARSRAPARAMKPPGSMPAGSSAAKPDATSQTLRARRPGVSKGRGQRHDAIGRPAPERDLQADPWLSLIRPAVVRCVRLLQTVHWNVAAVDPVGAR
jgi:hypothetical protein